MRRPQADFAVPQRSLLAWAGALLIAVLLFLLVPLTRKPIDPVPSALNVRPMSLMVMPPPPPPVPPPPPAEAVPPAAAQAPTLENSPPALPLPALELAVEPPGPTDALAMGAGKLELDPATQVDVVEEMRRVFQFSDLAEGPRMLSVPRFRYPPALLAQGVAQGRVELLIEIDERGRAAVHRVVTSSNPELIPVAREIVARARFSISRVDGKPVAVRGQFPVVLNAN